MIEKGKLYEYTGDGWVLLLDQNNKPADHLKKDDVFLAVHRELRFNGGYRYSYIWLIKGERVLFCSLSDYISQFIKEVK